MSTYFTAADLSIRIAGLGSGFMDFFAIRCYYSSKHAREVIYDKEHRGT